MIRAVLALVAAAAASIAAPQVVAAQAGSAETEAQHVLHIGYLDLRDDSRYRPDEAYDGIVFHTLGRPWPGAQLGIDDARMIGRVIGTDFVLDRRTVATPDGLATAAAALLKGGAHFIIADLPAPALLRLADRLKGQSVLLMNVSAREDSLRQDDCRSNVVHVIPSDSMLSDALVEYLMAKNWSRILVLQGPAPEDAREAAALERSAKKFGATVEGVRPFVLGTDPRHREENNVALMTTEDNSDVIFVADSSGEFARDVPYATSRPKLIVGDSGLTPVAWHWTWGRDGAPQLQHRFEALAKPRRMNSGAWAAWVAVKAVTEAAMRSNAVDFNAIRSFMLGGKAHIDGAKGRSMSFRTWDHQLRQPILLATADAVVAEAPLPQYLHQTDILDTLGIDAPESRCRF